MKSVSQVEQEASCGEHLAVSATHPPNTSSANCLWKRCSHFLREGLESLSLTLYLSIHQGGCAHCAWNGVLSPLSTLGTP